MSKVTDSEENILIDYEEYCEFKSWIEKELSDFRKTQKKGFYIFEPYHKDCIYNLSNFLISKLFYVTSSKKAMIINGVANEPYHIGKKLDYIFIDITIEEARSGEFITNLFYYFCPDCIGVYDDVYDADSQKCYSVWRRIT